MRSDVSNIVPLDRFGVELNPPSVSPTRVLGLALRLAVVAAIILAYAR